MGLFGKKKVKQVNIEETTKVPTLVFDYHPKIILAWAKGIEGNKQLLDYLHENGFPELVMANHAIKLKDEARDWLMKNGFPHIMAMINAAEGNEQAMNWLKMNKFDVLYYIAEAVDGEFEGQKGFAWIKKYSTEDVFMLAQVIKRVKDRIEETHNDVHSFGKD